MSDALRVGFPKPRALPPCLVGAHNDDCDRIRADVAKNTGLEVAECGCRCHGRDGGFVDDNERRISELRAEVQRLTAEVALKDQALDEIKHALESGTWPGYGLTVERIERILIRLDTQGETK